MTSVAIEMLESGRVDAVVCVQNEDDDRFMPKPVQYILRCYWQSRHLAVSNTALRQLRIAILVCTCLTQMVARCKEDILKAKGVKPTLSPNLNVLATVEALDVKKLLFIGVGCQVSTCERVTPRPKRLY